MAFRLRADNDPTLNAGLVAFFFRGSGPVLLKKLYFCDFPWGGGPDHCFRPLDPRIRTILKLTSLLFPWLPSMNVDSCRLDVHHIHLIYVINYFDASLNIHVSIAPLFMDVGKQSRARLDATESDVLSGPLLFVHRTKNTTNNP